jgi:paired amphipathic helix protein Sin3a
MTPSSSAGVSASATGAKPTGQANANSNSQQQQQQPTVNVNDSKQQLVTSNNATAVSATPTTTATTTTTTTKVLSQVQVNNISVNKRRQQLEWLKSGPINEINFFEKLKLALRTQQCYENFLKCLVLFNHDLINKSELIKLADPFLGKFPNLYRWFKDYVENSTFIGYAKSDQQQQQQQVVEPVDNIAPHKFTNTNKYSINNNKVPVAAVPLTQQNGTATASSAAAATDHRGGISLPQEAAQNVHLEIDYLSCKQYGASYRDISAYPQPLSSGQTDLCRAVLNSTYVSFPSWSEDSTFISSKKNQYEELIFRIEDERFELDLVLETNMSTIRVLENVMARIGHMTSDELGKFKLTSMLGGTSECIHVRAIQRIYGDKAKEFIEGIKTNPAVAVPLVLKRLRAKEDEWREAKKNLEKTWRDQIEKNYLKSLDYCAAPFKQNDQKHLKVLN